MIERRLQTRENKAFQHRRRQRQQERQKRNSFNCWLHTRLLKYNPSVLGTLFECEGINCTYFNFTWWPWKRLSSKKPMLVAKRWPTPHLTNKKRKPCRTMCTSSGFKILMNWTDALSCLGLRRAFAEEAKPRTYGDHFLPKERWSVILVKWWERLRLFFFPVASKYL